jgi:hypothetical protein
MPGARTDRGPPPLSPAPGKVHGGLAAEERPARRGGRRAPPCHNIELCESFGDGLCTQHGRRVVEVTEAVAVNVCLEVGGYGLDLGHGEIGVRIKETNMRGVRV